MFIATLYFLASFVFFGMFMFFLISYQKNHNRFVFYYSLTFLSMFLFTFSSSVPELVFTDNLTVLSWANVFSNVFIFTLLFACLRVQLIVTNHFFKKNFFLFNFFLGLAAAIVVGLQILHLKDPVVGNFAIFWNLYPAAGWIFGVLGISYGLFWSYLFHKVASLIEEKGLKKRMMSFSVNGTLYGIAGFCLFTQENLPGQIAALSLFGIGGLVSAFVFLPPYIAKIFRKPQAA